MPAAGVEKGVAIAGTALALCGFIYLFVDHKSFIPDLLILTGSAMAMWATRNRPNGWRPFPQDSRLDLGDILLLAGTITALLASTFLELPTREERGWALLGPAILFSAGILSKIVRYGRKFFGQNARARKP